MDSDSDSDSFRSALSTPGSGSSSPFTPLTPVESPAFEIVGSPIRITPVRNGNRNGGYQGMRWELPHRVIKRRRDVFVALHTDIISPLLPGRHLDLEARGRIQPYKLVHQPLGLRATLKPYQLQAVSFLLYPKNNGMNDILGDEMGLGKTLQTLSLFQYLKENTTPQAPFLVVCPLSVIDGWISEAAKWTPDLEVLKYHGSQEERVKIKAGVLAFLWTYIVLDEGHRIKNDESKKAHLLDRVPAEYKLVLTGTPVQNDLRELWAIFQWLYPEVFDKSTVGQFDEASSLNDGKFDAEFLGHCKRFLGLIMLRRIKQSPDVLDDQSSCVSSPGGDSFEHFEQRADVQKRRISMNILMELRKCSIHPYLLDDIHDDKPGDHTILNSGKFVILQKIIRQVVIEEHKKIDISNFEPALTLCEDLLTTFKNDDHHFNHARLDGRTSSAWRRLFVHLFTHDPRYKIFLVSIRAGGEGFNLTSSSTVVFLDEDWNPQVMRQAEARVHRIGQTQPVSIFKLYSRGTVEEQILMSGGRGFVQSDSSLLVGFAGEGIKAREIDTDELSLWNLETIVEKCRPRDGNMQKTAGRDEKTWLQRAESIRTNLFNGSTIDTTNRGFSIYKEDANLA
ncbi:hypothetical protein SI65_06667 [Aspergillus cristatus]|uniref:Uncharacterized protein n=1 Tax=Aspergillus cristatus TaxID=573508 RepID=A0A1E3BAB7_ASPCR|nr:hypothetical protein SI65_06667 [Aspergillus cristatus]